MSLAPDELRPWQLIRHAPGPVWVITALFALVLAAWSVLAPLYHAADEPNHADAVMRLVEGKGWPSSETARVTDQGVGATAASPYGTRARPLTLDTAPLAASAAPGREARPTWKQLQALPGTSGRLTQQITQQPPGYYWYEAVVLKIGGATGWRWDIAVSVMRLLSALLIIWLPLLSWATAWRMTGSRLAGIAASIVPLAVPELTHVGSTVNNDNLVTLAGAATLLGVACALRGDRCRSTALWTGLWLAIALWAKAFGLVLVPLVIGVYAIPWFFDRRRAAPDRGRGAAVALGWSAGVGIVLGCWWYVVNEVRYGSTQAGVPGFPPGTNLGNDHAALARYLSQGVLTRWWGSLGWFEVKLPWRLVIVATIVLGALGVLALWRGRRAPVGLVAPAVADGRHVSAGLRLDRALLPLDASHPRARGPLPVHRLHRHRGAGRHRVRRTPRPARPLDPARAAHRRARDAGRGRPPGNQPVVAARRRFAAAGLGRALGLVELAGRRALGRRRRADTAGSARSRSDPARRASRHPQQRCPGADAGAGFRGPRSRGAAGAHSGIRLG